MRSRSHDPNLREYLTIGEAAEFLGVSPWTLRNWDRAGRLKPVRHPKNGYRIYRQEDLQAVLAVGEASGTLLADYAPRLDWTQTGEREHVVQFYDTDAFLVSAVGRYIAAALDAGNAGVVIATAAHLREIERALGAREIDLDAARIQSRLITLDADETLQRILIAGSPDRTRFEQVIGATIDRASGAGRGQRRRVRAFGEMVALLWDRGNQAAAIQVEELWNDLAQTRDFALCCAYPLRSFAGASDGESFANVCAHHARVFPAESYARLDNADDRLREISQLQRKAQAVEVETAHRWHVEEQLRNAKAVAEMHGGRIDAQSEGFDRGASSPLALALVGDVDARHSVPAARPADAEKPGALRILLVDDHADTLNVLQRLLHSFGHTVLAAGTVSDAVAAVDANERIDLLISDLGLPDGTGLDVMRRARLRNPTLPAIALTGFGMDADIRSTEQAGFAAHLTKPVGLEALASAIRKVTGEGNSI